MTRAHQRSNESSGPSAQVPRRSLRQVPGTIAPVFRYRPRPERSETGGVMGRGLLLWLLGIPIPIILLIWLFGGLHG
jgi:hypothetical protein